MLDQTLQDVEEEVRRLAMSMPPSDFGSHRAVQAIAKYCYDKMGEAVRDALRNPPRNNAVTDLERTER